MSHKLLAIHSAFLYSQSFYNNNVPRFLNHASSISHIKKTQPAPLTENGRLSFLIQYLAGIREWRLRWFFGDFIMEVRGVIFEVVFISYNVFRDVEGTVAGAF